jgi:hypothetical protein
MVKAVAMLVVMVFVVATVSTGGAMADNCDPSQLSECEPALIGGSQLPPMESFNQCRFS